MKLKLKHVGAISLGKIAGIWGFIIAEIIVIAMTFMILVMGLIGVSYGDDTGGGVVGSAIFFVSGSIGAVFYAIFMFIMGALTAFIYTLILKVGGGLELEFEDVKK